MTVDAAVIPPVLATPFPNTPRIWTDPITGLQVPKDYNENLAYRARLLADAEEDAGFQDDLIAACRSSVLFWANAFVFTAKLREVDGEGHQRQTDTVHTPYITWDIQDRHIREIETAIEKGYDLATDKSRDMGASWDHILVIEHQFLFRPDCWFLEISRTEEYVDRSDNPKSLFWKHRYIRKWLPSWMVPPITDVTMHFSNLANGSKIDGESANANAASGDRRRAILLDEFAKVEQGTKIRWATSDVSSCRLVNSTPAGPGTEYSKWLKSGQIKVFPLPWWEHPEKGRGRYCVQDEITKVWKIRSPWYDQETQRRSPQEVAQEIDMDHVGSGATFFDAAPINQHRALFACEPTFTRHFDFLKNVAQDAIPGIIMRRQLNQVLVRPKGSWRFWTTDRSNRPDQTRTYLFGVDISKGQGASNSVVSVLCAETREKIAEFADANIPPYDLARMVAAAAIWFGGATQGGKPLVIWEANGPGWDFGRQFVKVFQYPHFYVDKASGTLSEKQSKRYGWHSSREKKEQLLGLLRRAYAHGGLINHSDQSLDEALSYVHYDDGGIGPAMLVKESESARRCHGDRVIADALTLLGVEGVPKGREAGHAPPVNSTGYRRRMALSKRRVNRVQWGARVSLSSGTPELTIGGERCRMK
jgi:hypothetical protein